MEAEGAYIPKLTNLSIAAAVEGFQQNAYNEKNIKIIPEYRHKLFDELYIPHVALTPEIVEEMLRMELTTNNLVLGRNNLSEHHRKLSFSLTELEKFTVLAWKIEKKYDRTVPGNNMRTIDIIAFLKDFLCPESRLALRELSIRGRRGIHFLPEWLSELVDLLPGITALDLSGCLFSDDDFRKLCERWPDLTNMHMEGTGIRNLDGIEKLDKLVVLSLESVHIDGKSSIEALSSLHNLEVLNMSFYLSSYDSSQQSLRDQISIPNLKVLDLSLCQLNEERAKKLFQLNPNLEKVLDFKSVQYTDFPCSFFERGKIDYEPTVEKFCYLLKHYEKSTNASEMVLYGFNYLLGFDLMRIETNAKELLMCLLEVLQNPMLNFEAKVSAVACMQSISRFPDFGNMLTFEEKKFIGKKLCNTIKTTKWNKPRADHCYFLFLYIVKFSLKAKLFEHIKLGNAFGDVCVNFIIKSFCVSNIPLMCEYLVLHNHKVDVLSHFKTDSIFDLKIEILKELQEEELSVRHCKPLLEFFAIIAKVSHSQLEIVNLNHNAINIIFKKIEFFEYDENVVQSGFVCLQLLYQQLKDPTRKKEQFKKNSEIIKTCVMSDNQLHKTSAIKFLIEAYKSNNEKELYEPLAHPELNKIVTEILDGDALDMDQLFQLVESLEGKEIPFGDILWLHQKLYKELPPFMNGPAQFLPTRIWIFLSEVFTFISSPCTHSE